MDWPRATTSLLGMAVVHFLGIEGSGAALEKVNGLLPLPLVKIAQGDYFRGAPFYHSRADGDWPMDWLIRPHL